MDLWLHGLGSVPGIVPSVVGKRVGVGSVLAPVHRIDQCLNKLATVIGVVHDNGQFTDSHTGFAFAEHIEMVFVFIIDWDGVDDVFTCLDIANGYDRPGLNF